MKKVEATIRASKFLEVKKALHSVGVNFFSYWEVNDVINGEEDSSELTTDETKKIMISIAVNDDFEKVTIKAILGSAFTGEIGDGRIFISKIEEAYKILSKEKGSKTLR